MSGARVLMSAPDFFEVSYVINPWMKDVVPVDIELARRQWESLRQAVARGARVELLPPVQGLPDLVFTANAAFVHGRQAILARYHHPERQGEEPHVERWFREHDYEVDILPRSLSFEGAGDALIYDRRLVLAGYRQRTDIAAHERISALTGLPVVSLELLDGHFYHIDVCLCPLSDGHLLYYPGAFDEYGLRVIEANVPEEKRLMTTRQEARVFSCNAVNLGQTVIMNQGSARLVEALRRRGFQVVEVDLSEFLKAGGSAKCLTLRL